MSKLEDDLIEAKVSYLVERRMNQIKNNPLIKAFVEYNPYESDKKREQKKMVIEFLFREIELHAKAYIMTNAVKTVYEQKLKLKESLEEHEERIAKEAVAQLRGFSKNKSE